LTVHFRFARPEELDEIVRLTRHSFPGVGRDHDWWMSRYRETVYGDGTEILWVGEDSGRLVATCQLHRIVHHVSEAEFPSMGLGTVAIAPTYRQRGFGGRMVATALEAASDRGDLLSSLYPFRASFYGRLGYGLCGDTHQYHIAPEALPSSELRAAVEVLSGGDDLREIVELYDRWARTQTGQVKRDARVWASLLAVEDRLLVAYRGTHGQLEGYALASYPTQLPPQERYLSIEEHAWTTPEARRALYGWMASMGDQWRALTLRALPEHRLEDWLREPRLGGGPVPQWGLWFPSAVLMRGPMFRVLKVDEAWSRRAVDPEASLTLRLDVTDEQLPTNSGSWRLRLEGGTVAVERGTGAADLTLRTGIQALSRIFLGALPPSAALAAGLVEVEGVDRLRKLDRALALPGSWTFDRY